MINLLREDQWIKRFHFQSLAAKFLKDIVTDGRHRAGISLISLGCTRPYANVTVTVSYWYAYISKNYQKTKEWEHEQEYRIVIDNYVCKYDDPNSRNLKYDFKSLKGVIFGINTSEYDKKRIVHSIMQKKGKFIQFAFYQAEYNDEEQKITVREKYYGYSELYNHLGE